MPLTTTAADFCRSLSGRPGRDRKGASSNAAPPNFSGELNRKGLLQIGRTMKVIRTVRVRGPDLSSSRVVDCIRKPYAPAWCVPVERRRRVFQKSRNRSQRTLAWFTNGGGGHLRTSLLLHGQLTPFASATRGKFQSIPSPFQRMPASISGTSLSIDDGVTTPAPVLSAMPGIRYFFDSTHCSTGTKPCR